MKTDTYTIEFPDVDDFQPPPDDALRGSLQVSDPADNGDESNGWAYAEAACGDIPRVALRIRLDETGWNYMAADDAVALGALLTRVGGAARAWTEAEAEFAADI